MRLASIEHEHQCRFGEGSGVLEGRTAELVSTAAVPGTFVESPWQSGRARSWQCFASAELQAKHSSPAPRRSALASMKNQVSGTQQHICHVGFMQVVPMRSNSASMPLTMPPEVNFEVQHPQD